MARWTHSSPEFAQSNELFVPKQDPGCFEGHCHPDIGLDGSFSVDPEPELDALVGCTRDSDAAVARWIMDNAWQALQSGRRGVSYSRRPERYADAKRRGWPVSCREMIRVVDHLAKEGLITNHIALPQPIRLPQAQQSWLGLTPRAAQFLADRGGVRGARRALISDVVRFKDRRSGKLLAVPNTGLIRRLRHEMQIIRASATAADWQPMATDIYEQRGDCLVLQRGNGPMAWMNTKATAFVHILGKGGSLKDWTCGRMYGFGVQSIPKDMRRAGTIGGQVVDEVDFRNMHLRLALAANKRPFADVQDLYMPIVEVSGESRDVVKIAVNIGLNALTRRGAIGATANAIAASEGRQPVNLDMQRAVELIRCIEKIYPSLRTFIGMDAGVGFMRTESTILRQACLDLAGQGFHFIPLHDALLVAQGDADRAEYAMSKASIKIVGDALPTHRLLAR